MNIGSVGGALPVAVSNAEPGTMQMTAAISMMKKAEQVEADTAQKLIASASGVGQRLDVVA